MQLKKYFRETVVTRASHDTAFRKAMLKEIIREFLSGDIDAAKQMHQDYLHAKINCLI